MPMMGNPTPAKPKAGETMMPARPSPSARSRTRSCNNAPIPRQLIRNSEAAMMTIATSPLNAMPSSPSSISGTVSMITKKIANNGASLPASATTGLPPAQASQVRMLRRRKLRADRITGGDGDDDVDHDRQQRAQQELRIIALRVDEHDRLGGQRSDARCFRRGVRHRAFAG